VLGVDASSEMLRLAEENARTQKVAIRTLQTTFDHLSDDVTERFEAVVCMGNSLAHLLTQEGLERALHGFASVLRPRGVLILQVLNYARILDKRERILNEKHTGDTTFVRSYEYGPGEITFNIVTRTERLVASKEEVQTISLRPITSSDLTSALERAGFTNISLFGGISPIPFEPRNSKDLVIVAMIP
jgi:2-polyprenyl-3-methyl-5-hydroxy-6-metoxy-1,4-benzoquinol methylase